MYYIFDTNFYRDIAVNRGVREVKKLMLKMQQNEAAKNIKPIMCSVVAQELVSHLADDGGGTNCTKACIALYLHTGNSQSFALVPLPEVQIAKMIYGVDWKQKISTQEVYGHILYELSSTSCIPSILKKYNKEIIQTRNHVLGSEATFADEVEKLFQQYDPNFKLGQLPFGNNGVLRKKFLQFIDSKAFEDETLYALLVSVYYYLQNQGYTLLPINQVVNYIPLLHDFYASSMAFRREYFKLFSQNGYDLRSENRSNHIWDEYILSSVGNTINGEEIGLVTSDSKIKEALLKFNPSLKIMSTNEYAALIGITDLKKKRNIFLKCVFAIMNFPRKLRKKLSKI